MNKFVERAEEIKLIVEEPSRAKRCSLKKIWSSRKANFPTN